VQQSDKSERITNNVNSAPVSKQNMANDMFKNANGKRSNNKKKARRAPRKKARINSKKVQRRSGKKKTNFGGIPITRNLRFGQKKQRASFKRNMTTMNTSGELLLGNLQIPANVSQGDVLFNQQFAPQLFIGTELQVYAKMYEKYIFTHLSVVFKPSCPTTSTGQMVSYIDPDMRDVGTSGTQGIRAAQSVAGSATYAVYTPATTRYVDRRRYPSYWCEDVSTEDLLCVQARFIAQANFNLSAGTAFQAGSYYLNYKCKFLDKHNQWSSISSAVYGTQTQASNANPSALTLDSKSSFGITLSGGVFTVNGFKTGDFIMFMYQFNVTATITTAPTFTFTGMTPSFGMSTLNVANDAWMNMQYGQVTASSGLWSWNQTVNPIFGGSMGTLRFAIQPFPGTIATITPTFVTPSENKKQREEERLNRLIEEKFARIQLNNDRVRKEFREGLPETLPLSDSEIDAFQKLESIELKRRGFSPTRNISALLPSHKQ